MTFTLSSLSAQDKVGINNVTPTNTLDVKSLDEDEPASMQLATPSEAHFLRFFAGRDGDPKPFILFNANDTFRIGSSNADYSNFTDLINVLATGNVSMSDMGALPNPNAVLDLSSYSKGFLVPRMSTTDREAITVGAEERGLMVYDTTVKAFFFYDGGEWKGVSEVLWMKDATGINRMSNIGVNSQALPNYGVYSQRNYGDAGSDLASIYGFRGGDSGSDTTGGVSFTPLGVDAAIKGFSDWGNPYSAAVAGFGYLDYANSAAVVGGTTSGGVYGALGYNMGGTIYSGYFMGNARFDDQVGIGAAPGDFTLNVQSSTEDRTGYFYNNKTTTANTFGIYAGAFGTGSGDKRGGSFDAFGGTGSNFGVRGFAANGSTNVGVYGYAAGGTTNWAGHFDAGYVIIDDRLGIGTTAPSTKLHIFNDELPISGYFFNTYDQSGWNYGAYASASNGGTGNAIGMYSSCSGTGNYAFYGVGDTYLSGDVRLGTTLDPSGYKLIVDGRIISEELRIQNSTNWPDYVFAEDYNLMPLEELERSIKANQHLPGIPSAAEVEEGGIIVGDMQKRMMEKIEELTLYVIDLNERIKTLEEENAKLKAARGN